MAALLDGFHQIFPHFLMPVFTEYELGTPWHEHHLIETPTNLKLHSELLISGQRTVDIADWEAHTEYSNGYTADSPQIRWFWNTVKSYPPDGTAPPRPAHAALIPLPFLRRRGTGPAVRHG